MQHSAAESEALLPAAGELCRQPIQVGCEAIELDDFLHAALKARGLQAVDAAIELQVFRNSQVVVEAEILSHVADALANGFRIGGDIEAFDEGGTAAERQKSGKHLDNGGFSAAVGAEKTEDFAFSNAETDVVDSREIAKTADEILRGDGGVCGSLRNRSHSFNSPPSVSRRQPCRRAPCRLDR